MFVFKKAKRYSNVRYAPIGAVHIDKAKESKKATLKKLRAFLDAEEPQTVEWLVSFWDKQSSAVTYKELREAILAGNMSQVQLNLWQKEYRDFVNEKLAPQWYKAIEAAAMEVKAQYPYFLYEPSILAAQTYIQEHGAELVKMLVEEQQDALQAMIAQASGYGATTADELSRIMRPVIGLTKPQSIANQRYYNNVKLSLLEANPNMKLKTAQKRAREAQVKYAAKQHRYRAQNIARTELAMAYNAGHYGAVKDAQAQGYIGDCKKIWLTADDERVCPICGRIDGESVNINDLFSVGVQIPPAHPSCRCAIAYEEISPPLLLTNPADSGIIYADSINSVGCHESGTRNNNRLIQSLSENEARIAKDGFETAIAFDENGNILFEQRGGENSVSFNPEQWKQIEGMIVTHNHSFNHEMEAFGIKNTNVLSSHDLMIAHKYKLNEIRMVVGDERHSFKWNNTDDAEVTAFIDTFKEIERLGKSIIQNECNKKDMALLLCFKDQSEINKDKALKAMENYYKTIQTQSDGLNAFLSQNQYIGYTYRKDDVNENKES